MKIYDCFIFFDEEVLLDLRLNILDRHVDKFVIVESKFSHSGEKRDPIFDINKYKKFKEKIIYILLEDQPKNLLEIHGDIDPKKKSKIIDNANLREFYQRNAITKGLVDASNEDLIIISDVDEIPNLQNFNFNDFKNKMVFFNQIFCCYKFNLYARSMQWYGSRMIKKKNLLNPQWLRDIKDRNYPFWRLDTFFSKKKYRNIVLIQDGGWHFSYLKNAKGVEKKLKSIRHHIEYDQNPLGIEKIENMIKERKLIYNYKADQKTKNKFLDNETLKILNPEQLPKYILLNKDKLKSFFY
tara:strand:+ start:366 stop:1256 length:891 start_codon:yes stop_codon:yes gene_type:complete